MQIKVKDLVLEILKNEDDDFVFCLKNGKNTSYKIIKREIIFNLILDSSTDFTEEIKEEFFEINKEEKKAIQKFLNKKMNLIGTDLKNFLRRIKKLNKEEKEKKEKENNFKKD